MRGMDGREDALGTTIPYPETRSALDRRMGRGSKAHTVNNHTCIASWPGPRRQRSAPRRRRRRRSLALRARAFSTILGSSPLSHVAAAATTTTMLHCVPREGRKEGGKEGALSNGAWRRSSPLRIDRGQVDGRTDCMHCCCWLRFFLRASAWNG